MNIWPLRAFVFILLSAFLCAASLPESNSDAIAVKQALDRLGVMGSVLMIAAHPDDENTALISYLARGRKVRMAYLSLTRGEGGQNAIGSEQGDELGIIRTQELLQSRRIDGGLQYFSRAIDFGYSKNPEEAIEKWGHNAILSDIVWVIRKFRPDVVILQFTGTYRDGHGQHQASAILGREAYEAAGDEKRFPEQLQYVRPWRAQRLMVNRRGFSPESRKEVAALPQKLELEMGAYDPLLGYSYGELAGISRSFNRSQSEGTPQIRGSVTTALVTIAGKAASNDLFDGIDITWNRYPGGAAVANLLREANQKWRPDHPEAIIATLAKARDAAAVIDAPEIKAKLEEFDETIARCAGFWLEFSADHQGLTTGKTNNLRIRAIRRTGPEIKIQAISVPGSSTTWRAPNKPLPLNEPFLANAKWIVPLNHPLSQPYWLREKPTGNRYSISDQKRIGMAENPAELTAVVKAWIDDVPVTLRRPLVYRYLDKLEGEIVKPVAIVPRASLEFLQSTVLFLSATPKMIPVEVTAEDNNVIGTVSLPAPRGWSITPQSQTVSLQRTGEQKVVYFKVTPLNASGTETLQATLQLQGQTVTTGLKRIAYAHFPVQTYFPPAQMKLVRTDVQNPAKRVGYIMGAGDEMPAALRQMGCNVTLLNASDLAQGDLQQFDAIVTGVRAYADRADLRAHQRRLIDYVAKGGTLVVQYNKLERASSEEMQHLGPYPFRIGFDRVSVEEAPVKLDPKSPLLSSPNQITETDFDGWVQERGLYFASSWDSHYQPLFEMHDPGEKPLQGATIVARYGKGAYVYTALSWFRQLPAGVPGAYRVFANLLNASKTLADVQ